jgi:flavin-dependent dehydrogenase
MDHYDVVIVGAGLAGLYCARSLSAGGAKVMLVDRKTRLDGAVHTTGIFVRKTLEDFDLPEDCLGPAVRHVSLYSPGRRRLNLESQHDEFRVGRMGLLYQRMLALCMMNGVRWSPATAFDGCDPARSGSIVRLTTGGKDRRVHTRFLVGADGAQSRVGAALGLDRNSEWIVGLEEVHANVPLDGPPRFHCFLDPELAPGYLGWIVHDGEEVHLGVGGYAEHFRPVDALEKFRRTVAGKIVDLGNARLLEKRGGRIPVGGVLRRIANERGLLIGDAAGAVSPLTAGGLDPCLRLSRIASNVIVGALNADDPGLLFRYSGDLFRSRFISRLWMRRIIANVRQRTLLELACAGMRLPGAGSLARHVFFGRGSFPDVAVTESDRPLAPKVARIG